MQYVYKQVVAFIYRFINEQDKTRVSLQLKVLSFIQSNGINELVLNINADLKHDSQYLLLLFMFLSSKLINSWLPSLIKSHKDSVAPATKNNKQKAKHTTQNAKN